MKPVSLLLLAACWGWMLAEKMLSSAHSAVDPKPKELEGWIARHKYINKLAKLGHQARMGLGEEANKVDVLYIGDSIVQKFEKEGRKVWAHYYRPRKTINLGISGDRTEHVLWRLENGNIAGLEPKLAIIQIGQNNGGHNTEQEIFDGVVAIVDYLKKEIPNMKILLLAVFFRGHKPNPERDLFKAVNTQLARKYSDSSDVTFMDINSLFVKPDGTIPASLFPDYEHPSEKGYMVWCDAIESTVATLLDDEPKEPMTLSDGKVVSAKWKGTSIAKANVESAAMEEDPAAEAAAERNINRLKDEAKMGGLVSIRQSYTGFDNPQAETQWLLVMFLTVLGVLIVYLCMNIIRLIRSESGFESIQFFPRSYRFERKSSDHGFTSNRSGERSI